MIRHRLGWAMGAIFTATAAIAAQDPPVSPQSPSRTQTAQELKSAVTVEGCLMREQDVPGRKPNVAERAGVMEDYILTNAKVIKGSAPQASTAKPGEPAGTAGTASTMYDVKGIDDQKLKQFVGKRVQIEGTFSDVTRSPGAAATEDLVDIQGTTIRAASGECPAK